jgi:hypothetical protein
MENRKLYLHIIKNDSDPTCPSIVLSRSDLQDPNEKEWVIPVPPELSKRLECLLATDDLCVRQEPVRDLLSQFGELVVISAQVAIMGDTVAKNAES